MKTHACRSFHDATLTEMHVLPHFSAELPQELVICDVDFHESEPTTTASTALPAAATAVSTGRTGFTAAAKPPNFLPLAPEQQRQLVQLVWGEPGVQPEAAWQQGLIWNDVPGLEWGLVQLSGMHNVRLQC